MRLRPEGDTMIAETFYYVGGRKAGKITVTYGPLSGARGKERIKELTGNLAKGLGRILSLENDVPFSHPED